MFVLRAVLAQRRVILAVMFDTPLFSSDQSIDRVLQAGLPVVLVIVDGGLPPALDSAVKTLAKTEAGKLLVVQLDRKDSPHTTTRFRAQSLPAVVTVKNGQAYSQAGSINSDVLYQHARYLLDQGPRPQQPAGRPAQAAEPGGGRTTAAGQAASAPVNATDATFDGEVLRSALPVVVDFWAPWCGPCRMVAPVLDKLAREWAGRVKIVKVNVDENPASAGRYGVQSIPTMLVVKNGRVVDQWAGALPEPAMRSRLSGLL
jgi:thioredoxin